MKVLEIEHITKKAGRRTLVDDMSFDILQGDVCGFVGPNGAGKTTLIRMISGLIRPEDGNIRIEGFDVQRDRMKALAQVGAIVESPVFFPYMSGQDNLLNLVSGLLVWTRCSGSWDWRREARTKSKPTRSA